jgi:hypothetical protein
MKKKSYGDRQKKYLSRAEYVIVAVTLLIAAFAILVGLDMIEIGEGGIQFVF